MARSVSALLRGLALVLALVGYSEAAYAATCGDSFCAGCEGENCSTCIGDCGSCLGGNCGNGICAGSENAQNCPVDCPYVPACGNSCCDIGETPATCASDCSTQLPSVSGWGIPALVALLLLTTGGVLFRRNLAQADRRAP